MENFASSSSSTSGAKLLPATLNNNDVRAKSSQIGDVAAAIPSLTSSTNESDENVLRRKLPDRKAKADKNLGQDGSKFLADFNPMNSEREKRKAQKFRPPKAPPLYDSKGILIEFQKDLCDCLEEECPGCHFPCPKCRSSKCGHECRQNRKWQYEKLEVENQPEFLRTNAYIVKR